jgi:23S rRNA (cytidine1920-2'-O)/16S rRNA (cytidine1409-2'-O)-methyltransferase
MTALERRPAKRRIDQLLVDRGLAPTREKARALLLSGSVRVAGQRVDKPGQNVPYNAEVEVTSKPRFVSRGGLKLEAALENWKIDASGMVCLDVGASTGGFTDCLLQHGAARVYAFDVGTNQIDWKLRTDPRVVVREGINARHLTPADLPQPVDLIVCDVSFISLELIIPVLPPLLRPGGRLVMLIKPQFEVGREQVGKGGIVKDPALHAAVCDRIARAVESAGFRTALMESPILGAEGNREFLLYGSR